MGVMTVREFSQDTSEAIHRVEAGEEIHLTKNGRPVALIIPVRQEHRWREALASTGPVDAPGAPTALTDLEPLAASADAPTPDELLPEVRDES